MKEEREMYMIVRPDGSVIPCTENENYSLCIELWWGDGKKYPVDEEWIYYYREGYRCEKVKVTYEIIEG